MQCWEMKKDKGPWSAFLNLEESEKQWDVTQQSKTSIKFMFTKKNNDEGSAAEQKKNLFCESVRKMWSQEKQSA